jgi:hypothetical protein
MPHFIGRKEQITWQPIGLPGLLQFGKFAFGQVQQPNTAIISEKEFGYIARFFNGPIS